MQIYKPWASVVTLVILKFERKHTQEGVLQALKCHLGFSCPFSYQSWHEDVGVTEGGTALDVPLCLHLKLHHLRISAGRFRA